MTNSEKSVLGTNLHPDFPLFDPVSLIRDSSGHPIICSYSHIFSLSYGRNTRDGSVGFVVVLAGGASISACGQHVVTSPRSLIYSSIDGLPARFVRCRQSPTAKRDRVSWIAPLQQQVGPSPTAYCSTAVHTAQHEYSIAFLVPALRVTVTVPLTILSDAITSGPVPSAPSLAAHSAA